MLLNCVFLFNSISFEIWKILNKTSNWVFGIFLFFLQSSVNLRVCRYVFWGNYRFGRFRQRNLLHDNRRSLTGGGSMNLENPRKTLKCIFCDMYALTQIFSRNSSLVETIDFSQSHIKKLNNWNRRLSNFENVHALNLSYNQIDDLRITKKLCRTYNSWLII